MSRHADPRDDLVEHRVRVQPLRFGLESEQDAVPEHRDIRVDAYLKIALCHLKLGNANVELWEYRTPEPEDLRSPANGLGYPHIAISVTDIEDEAERLLGLGMTFVGPPVDMGHQKAIYGRDPFGNLIELYEWVG